MVETGEASSSSIPHFEFEVLAKMNDGAGRVGAFKLDRATVKTPVFMPVGTQGTIKGLAPFQVADTGCRILLCNTYHLGHRPGHKIVKSCGGLHKMMAWPYNILTDSGGFQMVSLGKLMSVTEDGVQFTSPHTEEITNLTPEHSIEIQQALGSDIMMQLDHVIRTTVDDEAVLADAAKRSVRWLARCNTQHDPATRQILFPIIQGGVFDDIRAECVDAMRPFMVNGVAVGGLSGGEAKDVFWRVVAETVARLPDDLPRYVMGVGWQIDIVICALLGADMFDCVYPTRTARFGTALVFYDASSGELRLTQNRFKKDRRAIEEDCDCTTCQRYTRAFIHAALHRKESIACHLVSVHNIRHQMRLTERIRAAIVEDRVPSFLRDFLRGQFGKREDIPDWVVNAIDHMGLSKAVFVDF